VKAEALAAPEESVDIRLTVRTPFDFACEKGFAETYENNIDIAMRSHTVPELGIIEFGKKLSDKPLNFNAHSVRDVNARVAAAESRVFSEVEFVVEVEVEGEEGGRWSEEPALPTYGATV